MNIASLSASEKKQYYQSHVGYFTILCVVCSSSCSRNPPISMVLSIHLQLPSYPCPLRFNEEISVQAEIINQKSGDIPVSPNNSLERANYTGKLHNCNHNKFKTKNMLEKTSIIRSGFRQRNKNCENIKKMQSTSLNSF